MLGVGDLICWGCFGLFLALTFFATIADLLSRKKEDKKSNKNERDKQKENSNFSENGLQKRPNKLQTKTENRKHFEEKEEDVPRRPFYAQLSDRLTNENFRSEFLLCFSVVRNTKSIFTLERTRSDLDLSYLHGLRAILSLSVSALHYHLLALTDPEFSSLKVNRIALSVFSLSWFFLISAMLNSYLTFRRMEKGNFCIPKYILKRFARLAPPMYAAIFYTIYLAPRSSTGNQKSHFRENCLERNWHLSWSMMSLLSESDFIPSCLDHSWFAENDFILMICILPLLFLYPRHPKVSFLICFSLTALWTAMVSHYNLNNAVMERWKAHNFTSSWALGIWLGYMLWKKKRFNVHWLLDHLLWIGFYLLCLIFPAFKVLTQNFHYFSIQWAWVLSQPCIAYVTWCLNQPKEGAPLLLKRFLSHPLWQPLSRISYTSYLFHMLFMKDLMVDPNIESGVNLVLGRQVLVISAAQMLTLIPAILVEEPTKKLSLLFLP